MWRTYRGLKRAGFRVTTAVEIEKHAFATYKTNHPEVRGYKQDIRTVAGSALLSHSATKRVDILAGCPPCQGFSSLTSKLHRSDPRDELVYEMGRLVSEIKPEIVMVENVPGAGPARAAYLRRLSRRALKTLATSSPGTSFRSQTTVYRSAEGAWWSSPARASPCQSRNRRIQELAMTVFHNGGPCARRSEGSRSPSDWTRPCAAGDRRHSDGTSYDSSQHKTSAD